LLLTLLATLVAAIGTLALTVAAATPASADNWAPVSPGDFPDPDIVLCAVSCGSGGPYYAFATQNFASAANTINIQELESSDGVHWHPTPGVPDALPSLGNWAKPGDTWAPSVSYDSSNNLYVMYYTATEASAPNDQCIGWATSNTPMGPYSSAPEPAICQDGSTSATIDNGNYGGSIDPDIFTDPQSNQTYLIWKNDGNHEDPGLSTSIWSVPLAQNFLPEAGSVVTLLAGAQYQWQSGIIEGPNMYYQPGTGTDGAGGAYYLFYSASDEGSASYAIGYASCSGPVGPCTDDSSSSLLSSQPGLSGPGGPSVYTLPSGQTVMGLAGWQGTTIGYLNCGIRPMYLATVSFGDVVGGTPTLSAYNQDENAAASPSCPPPPPLPPAGYWQVASDGGIFTFGSAQFYGSTGSIKLNKPVVGMAATPDGNGYWLVASDGGIFAYGDAQFYGSTGSLILNKPIVGMVPTLTGGGYWLIASDGGVFAFGNAQFYGSLGGDPPPYAITSVAPGFLDGGYWMVDANGQVFNFGDAPNKGSPASAPGGFTISGIAPTHDYNGYWLSSWNGNVANFGDAPDLGSMYGTNLNAPVVGITTTGDGGGFWLQGSDGGIFTFGDAPFLGSMGGQHLNAPMVGITSR
jgi:hypothetical protein